MRISAHKAALLTATAILLVGGAAIAQENTQGAVTMPLGADSSATAPALADVDTDNVVLAQADTSARPVQVAQLGTETITVSARRVNEDVQKVPVAISVVSDQTIASTGAYNVNRLTQLQPSLQFYSQNPRNTSVNIRGIGAPLGLTNDGIEQGVGIYVDQVYYNRVAAATLDFVDIEQIEILRGPQGTLYGKNTTAGAINITTRAPSFEFEGRGEISGGNYDFKQAKASISGPLTNDIAFRLSASHTERRGSIFNIASNTWINGQDNFAVRGAVLWNANLDLKVTVSADYNVQNANCCAQYFARVGVTQRPLNRQFDSLARALNYEPPSRNAFDRVTDIDAPLSARNELGGASVVAEWDVGGGTVTSVTAWRYWDWGPKNDRDFTGLPITPQSQNPTKQEQYTQEIRYAYEAENYDFVVGVFGFKQGIHTNGTERQGSAASRFTLNPGNVAVGAPGCATPTTRACIPAVLDNLVAANKFQLKNKSAALFGKLNYRVTDKFTISPGVRFNYDEKSGFYSSVVTGTTSTGQRAPVLFSGPFSTDPWIVEQRGVRAPIFYAPVLAKSNVSYDLNLSYQFEEDLLGYATYAKTYKSGGINLNGIPADGAGVPILAAATIKPEDVNHFEVGGKSQWLDGLATLNVTGFWTIIKNYQANVNNGALGLVRGYLANAGKVQVRGFEVEGSIVPTDWLSTYASGTYNDHSYVTFVDAPCPPEFLGGTTVTGSQIPGSAATPGALSAANCNISGQWLPGISKYALSWGAEATQPAGFAGKSGTVYLGYDASFRSKFSSNASRSIYTDIDGYSLHNFRVGFRTNDGLDLSLWLRNAFDKDYYEQLTVTPSNTGLIAGQPADPRTFGATLRYQL
jgi:iron complex outermembrane receptor protein